MCALKLRSDYLKFTNCFHCVNTDLFGPLSLKQIFSDFHTSVSPLNHG